MRTLAITQNVTVDGSIEMLDDWFDPQGQGGADPSDLIAELHRQDRESDAFLVGRRTFEDLRDYWRDLQDDTTGVSADLVDEYRLFTYPVVQGRGRRLFPDGFALPRLERRAVKDGVSLTRYRVPRR